MHHLHHFVCNLLRDACSLRRCAIGARACGAHPMDADEKHPFVTSGKDELSPDRFTQLVLEEAFFYSATGSQANPRSRSVTAR